MMYFTNFPQTLYRISPPGFRRPAEYVAITDIIRNVRFKTEILDNITLYDYYIMKDGESIETVSELLYDSPYYHWVLMLLNNRFDYLNDFPLDSYTFNKYVDNKYMFPITILTFATADSFTIGSTVTGSQSGARGTVILRESSTAIAVRNIDGTFVAGETLTSGTLSKVVSTVDVDTYPNYQFDAIPDSLIVDLVDPQRDNKSIDYVTTVANPSIVIDKNNPDPNARLEMPLMSLTAFDPILQIPIKKFINLTPGPTQGTELDLRQYRVDFGQTPDTAPIYALDKESQVNEDKREIKVISEIVLQTVLKNFKDLL